MTEALLIAVLIVGIANLALVILLIGGRRDAAREIDRLKRDMLDEQRALRAEVSENTRRSINAVGETLLNEYQRDTLNQEQRFKTFAMENAQRMEQIRRSVERQLADIREDNGKKLDEMRSIVDEKLQKTLEDKLSRSFALVSERLEQVYKGLGEMQTLASGVGDLSKVLSNVKTRGILGEIQLGAILGEMMAPEQYEVNAKVKQATNERNLPALFPLLGRALGVGAALCAAAACLPCRAPSERRGGARALPPHARRSLHLPRAAPHARHRRPDAAHTP